MIFQRNQNNRFSLGKHKRVEVRETDQTGVKSIIENLDEKLSLKFVMFHATLHNHFKTCIEKWKHDEDIKVIEKLRPIQFYAHKTGSPVYILLLKLPNNEEEFLREKYVDDFVIVDYFFSLEDLELQCNHYQKLQDQGKVLLKVFTKSHPLNVF